MSESVTQILDALRILVQALQVASRSSQQTLGLSGAQLFVLEKLAEADELTVNELAERTHTHQSTVSVVVSKLVDKGLVSRVRSEKDARVQLLSITRQGRAKLDRSPETIQDRLLRSIKGLAPSDRAQLGTLLSTIVAETGLGDVKPELFLENGAAKKESGAARKESGAARKENGAKKLRPAQKAREH